MRTEYFWIIEKHSIDDVLGELDNLPYSRKFQILQKLLLEFPRSVVNISLMKYKENYINKNRVDYIRMENMLKFYCKEVNKLADGD